MSCEKASASKPIRMIRALRGKGLLRQEPRPSRRDTWKRLKGEHKAQTTRQAKQKRLKCQGLDPPPLWCISLISSGFHTDGRNSFGCVAELWIDNLLATECSPCTKYNGGRCYSFVKETGPRTAGTSWGAVTCYNPWGTAYCESRLFALVCLSWVWAWGSKRIRYPCSSFCPKRWCRVIRQANCR